MSALATFLWLTIQLVCATANAYILQICTDYLSACDAALARTKTQLVDRQLACMPIQSQEGQAYLGAMAAAANFAFANRSLIMKEVREAFETTFGKSAREVRILPATQ